MVKIKYTNCFLLSAFQTKKDAKKYHSMSLNYLESYKNELFLKEVKYKTINSQQLYFYKMFYTDISNREQIIKNNTQVS